MFPDTAGAGKDHAHRRRGDIYAFIQHFTGDQHRIFSGAERIKECLAFGTPGVVRHHRKGETPPDGVCRVVVRCEDDDPLSGVGKEDFLQ